MRELAGLQGLARSLVHGDADADDLIQETAIAAVAHPPAEDQPVGPWLVTVLRNRWRMDRRARARRQVREEALGLELAEASRTQATAAPERIDRARALQRLANALAALDEPFRTAIIRRYLDGQSAAAIARELGIPAGTVRWRLKTGLERLRTELDRTTPRWQRALVPLATIQGATLVKAKTSVLWLLLLLFALGGALTAVVIHRRTAAEPSSVQAAGEKRVPDDLVRGSDRARAASTDHGATRPDPLPGQGRVVALPVVAPGGVVSGRVINWSTGDGVGGAELTFMTPEGLTTVRSQDDGAFELAPPKPGPFALATIVASGFLPYAPELEHSPVRFSFNANQAVRGLTLFLFPALDYVGTVIDETGAPVAGARVAMAASPAGEQTLESITSTWTTDRSGAFTFHAPDFSVFEASLGAKRGWAMLDGNVATTRRMTITLGDAPPRDASIRGKVVDSSGEPLPNVLVSAVPSGGPAGQSPPRSNALATSADDGTFALEGLDRETYLLTAELDEFAPARREVKGGTHRLVLTLETGAVIGGIVRDPDDQPVPAFTLLVTRRRGVIREVVTTRSVIDPSGRFRVHVVKGDYELLVSGTGWAPSPPVPASSGMTDVRIDLGAGATLKGTVVDADSGAPLAYARVNREGATGGASARPANAGTVTRTDGSFELTGIPAGPLTISVGAGDYHPRLEGGLVAVDGGTVGPIKIPLTKLAPGEAPKIEFVGIGVKLSAGEDSLRVDMVVPEGGAAAAGIVAGDHIVAVDGAPVTELGMDGAVARIRGVAHTNVTLSIRRGDELLQLVVERRPLHA